MILNGSVLIAILYFSKGISKAKKHITRISKDQVKKLKTAELIEETGDKKILVRFPYPDDFDAYQNINMLPQRIYNYEKESWTVPLKLETIESLINWGFNLDPKLLSTEENLKQELNNLINSDIKGLKCLLYQFQKEGVAFIERCNGRALISDETGLGKTLQALAWLQKHPDRRPVVIVVPYCHKLYWKNEAERWMSNPQVEILSQNSLSGKLTGEINIISYDELVIWADKLKRIKTQILILDEIHYIRDRTSNQTKAVKKLAKNASHIICLTGISIAARPIEAYNAIKIIQPDLFPSPAGFIKRYGNIKPTYYSWESYGVSPGKTNCTFSRSEEKLTDFMNWLQEQVEKGLIEIREFNQVGDGIESEWTNKYIADSYKRKELRSRYELAKEGINVPSGNENVSSNISISTPFHIDRVGLLFTRVFSDLQGISVAMDAVISRILAQGMADGEGSVAVARKIEAAINGSGLGDLGITNEFIAEAIISAKRRAKMLAHTEMMRAYHKSAMQDFKNWRELGIDTKAEWKTAGDNRVCDLCKALEGKIFTVEEIEDMIPLHPECRCIALPYIEELQKYYSKPVEKEDWLGKREGIDTKSTWILELYTRLTHTIMIRRLKKDVQEDLPPRTFSFIPLEMDNIKEYYETEKNIVTNIKQKSESGFDSNTINSQIDKLLSLSVRARLKQSIAWIKDFLEVGNKLCVITIHQFVIDSLTKSFPKVSVKLDNSVAGSDQNKIVNDFQANPKIRLLVSDLNTMGIDLTLHTISYITLFDQSLFPSDWAKTSGHLGSIGKSNKQNIYCFFADDSIEEKIVRLNHNNYLAMDHTLEQFKTNSESLFVELLNKHRNSQ